MESVEAQKKAALAFRKRMLDSHEGRVPISEAQKALSVDKPVRGPYQIDQVTVPAPPEPDLEEVLWRCVNDLGNTGQIITRPQYAAQLNAQWTTFRPDAAASSAMKSSLVDVQSPISPAGDKSSGSAVLSLHGGGFCYGSLMTARPLATQISQHVGARVLTIAYRLAPRHTFPAFLLDALTAYFTLLSPPSGSSDSPISPSNIVLAGESAGGNLQLALVQVLLHARRLGVTSIRFNGRTVPIDGPACVACMSPTTDWTNSLPSCDRYAELDWSGTPGPWLGPTFPADHIWPSKPPRGEIFVDTSALDHPLLSIAALDDWTGAPPMFLSTSHEALADGIMLVAQSAARQGVPVQFQQYEGMPHLFYTFLPKTTQAVHVNKCFMEFCKNALQALNAIGKSQATFFEMGGLKSRSLDPIALTSLRHKDAVKLMEDAKKQRTTWVWTGPSKLPKASL